MFEKVNPSHPDKVADRTAADKEKPCSTPSEAQVPPSSAANSWTDAPAPWNSTHTTATSSSPVGRS